jgi:hypothetical protein
MGKANNRRKGEREGKCPLPFSLYPVNGC